MANCTPIIEVVLDGNGNPQNFPVPPSVLQPIWIDTAGGFPLVLVAATAGMLVRVYRLVLAIEGATVLTFYDGATPLAPVLTPQAGEQIIFDMTNLFPWYQGSVNTAFTLGSTANVQLTGACYVSLNAT